MNLVNSTQTIAEFGRSTSQYVSVAVGQTDIDQSHCCIFYKFDDQCNALHLAWHHSLQHDPADKPELHNYCCIISQLEEHRQYALCAICDAIKEEIDIPYGILYRNTVFTDDGKLSLGDAEVGLTCATFVLAVFKSCQINLLNIATWPSREDDIVFQRKILEYLSNGVCSGKVSSEHYAKVQGDIGCARFRPEEVAAGSGFEFADMPVPYDALRKIAEGIQSKLRSDISLS